MFILSFRNVGLVSMNRFDLAQRGFPWLDWLLIEPTPRQEAEVRNAQMAHGDHEPMNDAFARLISAKSEKADTYRKNLAEAGGCDDLWLVVSTGGTLAQQLQIEFLPKPILMRAGTFDRVFLADLKSRRAVEITDRIAFVDDVSLAS